MNSLQNRRLLRITGPDRDSFLQGLITNDMERCAQGAIYAAMLTPQGKYMADFFVSRDGETVLVDTDASQTDMLAQRLNMYKLRAAVEISEDKRTVTCGLGQRPTGAFSDPRHPDLGWRSYGTQPSEQVDWNDLYVRHSVPSAGVELTPDSCFILEMGFERLNGVDFKKGCYVGQEVTARMKHKTELRKGLAQLTITGSAPIGTKILTQDDKEAGTLYSQSGGLALAYLRFDRANGPLSAAEAQLTYTP